MHGDDLVTSGEEKELQWLDNILKSIICVLGRGSIIEPLQELDVFVGKNDV